MATLNFFLFFQTSVIAYFKTTAKNPMLHLKVKVSIGEHCSGMMMAGRVLKAALVQQFKTISGEFRKMLRNFENGLL